MNFLLSNSKPCKGMVELPFSKSISNRLLIVKALSEADVTIENIASCDDTEVLSQALFFYGATIDVGMAGTAMRFLTALLALKPGEKVITGNERMLQRPIGPLVTALKEAGANIEYLGKQGFPPLRIEGKTLIGGEVHIDASVSSQYISALMLIAPYCTKGMQIKLQGKVSSESYINLTQQVMERCGVKVERCEKYINITPQKYCGGVYNVEADWSAASYWYSYMALKQQGELTLKALTPLSKQGDAAIQEIYRTFGVISHWENHVLKLNVEPNIHLETLELDCSSTPDIVQTIAVTACFKECHFRFTGVKSLAIKESNRLHALQVELAKCGYLLEQPNDDTLMWSGKRCEALEPLIIDTYNDHRMAMAFAPIVALRDLTIAHGEVVSKSYPHFWRFLHSFCTIVEEK